MGLLYKGLSVWVQSRLDPCPKDTYIHTYICRAVFALRMCVVLDMRLNIQWGS